MPVRVLTVVKKTAKKSVSQSRDLDFEAAIKELESLVERMEQGDQSLEQSLKDFERGVELTRTCQQALKQAEQKVQQLQEQTGQAVLTPLDDD